MILLMLWLALSTPLTSGLIELCPNPYGSDGSEYVKFYCNSSCTLSDGEGTLKVGRGYYIATKDKDEYVKHFGNPGNFNLVEFPQKMALSNRGEYICLNDDCFDYSFFLDDGVVYYRTEKGWDFRYEDWSTFECVEDTVNLTLTLTPSTFKLPDGYVVASYTFAADFTPAELFVDASPINMPCRELEVRNAHFLSSNSYRVFHYKFAVKDDSVIITTENWIFTKKGFIVEFKSDLIAEMLERVLENDEKYSSIPKKSCERWNADRPAERGKRIDVKSKVTAFVLPDCNPIFDLMDSAKSRLLIISPYMSLEWFEGMKGLRDRISDAIGRGVDVKIVLDGRYADREVIDELKRMGAKVILTHNLHAKAVVSDDRLLITSANMNRYGLKLNREVGVVIYNSSAADFVYNIYIHNGFYDYSHTQPSILIAIAVSLITAFILRSIIRKI